MKLRDILDMEIESWDFTYSNPVGGQPTGIVLRIHGSEEMLVLHRHGVPPGTKNFFKADAPTAQNVEQMQ